MWNPKATYAVHIHPMSVFNRVTDSTILRACVLGRGGETDRGRVPVGRGGETDRGRVCLGGVGRQTEGVCAWEGWGDRQRACVLGRGGETDRGRVCLGGVGRQTEGVCQLGAPVYM